MNGALRWLLGGPSWVYGLAIERRNRHYDHTGAVVRGPLPVISVGNLTVGGTGKTPLVAWIARHLCEAGLKPAVVSRGYGGSAGRGPRLVSHGAGPLEDPRVAGDEPWWLARTLPGVTVVVGSDRVAGVRAAAEVGAQVVILDDGFQHRRLWRDLDLVLLDSSDPFGGERLLPAGRLREPVRSLRRADVVLVTRCEPGRTRPDIELRVRQHNAVAPILLAGHRSAGFVDSTGQVAAPPGRVVAFCGIADPRGFRLQLERAGLEIVELRSFRDHHVYDERQIDALASRATAAAATLVTTEKDLARLEPLRARGALPRLLALRLEVWVADSASLLERLRLAAAGYGQ